jgi:integrase
MLDSTRGTVIPVLTTKSGNDRVVPITPELRVVLEEAMRLKLARARLAVNGKGNTPVRAAVLSALKACERRNGLREWSFHSLRHFFCSAILRRGGTLDPSESWQVTRAWRSPR